MKKKMRNLIRPVYAIVMSAVLLFVSVAGLGYAWYHTLLENSVTIEPNSFNAEIYVDGELVSDGTVANIPLHFNSCTYLPDASKPDFRAEDFDSVCRVVTVKIKNTGVALVKTYVEVKPNFTVKDDKPPILYTVFTAMPASYFDSLTAALVSSGLIANLTMLTKGNQVEVLDEYNKSLASRSREIFTGGEEEVFIVFWADFFGLLAQGYEVGGYAFPEIPTFSFTISAMAVDENFKVEE